MSDSFNIFEITKLSDSNYRHIFRASADPETTAKVLEAYLCIGNPYWPLDLSNKSEHLIFKTSVILAHFLICNENTNLADEDKYRARMVDSISNATQELLLVVDKETGICLGKKVGCQIYEHVCGADSVWNLQNTLQFIQFYVEGAPDGLIKKVLDAAVPVLLKENNLQILLTKVSPLCPNKTAYCGFRNRARRDVSIENKIEQHLELNHLRRKRFFDPSEMMRLFNKVICRKEIMEALSGYWEKQHSRHKHSAVWEMRVVSDFGAVF